MLAASPEENRGPLALMYIPGLQFRISLSGKLEASWDFYCFFLITFLKFPSQLWFSELTSNLKVTLLKWISKSSDMKLWRGMLFYCLEILLLSKDIRDLGILLIFFQSMFSIVDEFEYYAEGLSFKNKVSLFLNIFSMSTKDSGVQLYLMGSLLSGTSPTTPLL